MAHNDTRQKKRSEEEGEGNARLKLLLFRSSPSDNDGWRFVGGGLKKMLEKREKTKGPQHLQNNIKSIKNFQIN